MWAGGEILAGEGLQQLLPGFVLSRGIKRVALGFIMGSGFLESDEAPGFLQFRFGIAGSHEAEVADFDKARGQDVQQKTADELRGGGGH